MARKAPVRQGLDEWVDFLADKQLPMFAHTARMLGELREDSGIPMDRVCSDVLVDPGACLSLIKQANGMKRGRLGSEVTTVESAAMMLGINQLKKLPSGQKFITLPGKSLRQTWFMRLVSRNFHAASQAYDWALMRGDMMPKEVYVAAFMHNIAGMLMWVHAEDSMWHINALVHQERMSIDEAQYLVLGFGFDQLSAELAKRWHLPELVYESLDAENIHNPRVFSIRLAIQLARYAEYGWYGEQVWHCMEDVAEMLALSMDELVPRVHQVARDAALDTAIYGVRPAATLLPMLEGQHPPEQFPPEWSNFGAAGEVAGKPGIEQPDSRTRKTPAGSSGVCLIPQLDVFQQVALKLSREVDTFTSLNDVMKEVLKGLHDGIGLNRVAFAMMSQDELLLKSRFMSGVDNDAVFSHFIIHNDGKNLFSKLVNKQQSVWLNEENFAKFWPLVPPDFAKMIEIETFFAMSIIVNEKAVGFFYADRHTPNCKLDEASYKRFKQMVTLAGKTIEKVQARNKKG